MPELVLFHARAVITYHSVVLAIAVGQTLHAAVIVLVAHQPLTNTRACAAALAKATADFLTVAE